MKDPNKKSQLDALKKLTQTLSDAYQMQNENRARADELIYRQNAKKPDLDAILGQENLRIYLSQTRN